MYIQYRRGLDSHYAHYEKRKNGRGYLLTHTRPQFNTIGDGAGTHALMNRTVHYESLAARTELATPAWTPTFDKLSHLRSTILSTLEILTFRMITLTIQ